MRLHFWGAARTVTGSMHLVETAGGRLLLDCGLYQGPRKEAFERNRNFPFEPRTIDAVILSHAHIDHSGNLPSLVRAGFAGSIYATGATRDLAEYMLLDSAHIQEGDVAYVNRRRRAEGRRAFEPLYTQADAKATLRRFESVEYGPAFEPIPGVRACFRDAGHMLGSASVVLDIEQAGTQKRLVFSGDIGRQGLPILRDPQTVDGAQIVIMESTYGNRRHEPADRAEQILRDVAQSTYDSGGKLLIPAFAVGRTQEVVYHLNRLWEQRQLPPMDVYVDSPLAVDVTGVFRNHPECYDSGTWETVQNDADRDPFGFRRLRYVRNVEESKALGELRQPAIIISASGMCEAGRILHHLKRYVGDPHSTVLMVGYQAEHTLGRRLLDGRSPVPILGREYPVRARIQRADSYSAHADGPELLEWVRRLRARGAVERIFLVHGEASSADALAESLRSEGGLNVAVPDRGDAFDV